MIIPSVDLMGGSAVQLVRGREKKLDAGDPRPIARKFGRVGEIAVVDLDAALSLGSNEAVVRELLELAPCRVGGGIRDLDTARRWLDAGAEKVVIGTAARPDVLEKLPRERVIAALDAVEGEVVVEGWRTKTGARVQDRVRELRGLVGGFLVTFVEREGTMTGTNLELAAELKELAGDARLTVAGGVRTVQEISALDLIGVDAQIGMALYTGAFDLAAAVGAMMSSDRADGLWPTVVVDERGVALGMCWSDEESLRVAIEEGVGAYKSRTRGLWRKGATSGATQELVRVDMDCDRDCLRFTVRQREGFCHAGTRSCWGAERGLGALAARMERSALGGDGASYTARLLREPGLLEAKLVEEAGELGSARLESEVVHEAADVLFFALAAMRRAGVSLEEVERELDTRALRVTRRAGDAKAEREAGR